MKPFIRVILNLFISVILNLFISVIPSAARDLIHQIRATPNVDG